jgi:hypothetical protein
MTRDDIAQALCEHFFGSEPDASSVIKKVTPTTEADFIAHYLNGPGADRVMATRAYRWLSVHAEDLAQLKNVGEFRDLCHSHIVAM